MKLSIIIPAYNEEKTMREVLEIVSKVKLTIGKEIIIMDDGSTDKTADVIKEFISSTKKKDFEINLFQKKNGGKGSAVKEGIKRATGGIIIIQDADLEYDPNEYQNIINPILNKRCKVVYGSRRLKSSNKKYSGLSFYLGGILVTLATNLLFGSKLTDEPTCYKTFDAKLIKGFEIRGNKFEWE